MYFTVQEQGSGVGQVSATSLCFHDQDDVLFCGDSIGRIHIFQLISGKRKEIVSVYEDQSTVLWSASLNGVLVVQGRSAPVKTFTMTRGQYGETDINTDAPLHDAFCKGDSLKCAKDSLIAIGANHSNVAMMRVPSSGKMVLECMLKAPKEDNTGMITAICIVQENLILTGYENCTISEWACQNEPFIRRKLDLKTTIPLSIRVSDDGVGIAGGHGSTLTTFDQDMAKLKERLVPCSDITDITLRHSGVIAASCGDRTIRLFNGDAKKLKPLGALKFHTQSVDAIAHCARKGQWLDILAAASKDGRVSLWDLPAKKPSYVNQMLKK